MRTKREEELIELVEIEELDDEVAALAGHLLGRISQRPGRWRRRMQGRRGRYEDDSTATID
jgi:hypothetical protein